MNDRSTHMAVIGAGPVGLAVARALLQNSIPYEQLEADDDLGGNCAKLDVWTKFEDLGVGVQIFEHLGRAGEVGKLRGHREVGILGRLARGDDVRRLVDAASGSDKRALPDGRATAPDPVATASGRATAPDPVATASGSDKRALS